ncbi:MAG: hypothetical protein ACREIF_12600 [Chthoniobacterales bacterium]
MDHPNEGSKSLYDYSDKSVQHAGYAAIVYAAISLFTGALALIQYFLYHTPGKGSVLPDDFAAQQYLQHTPLLTAVTVAFSIIIAGISGVLAFFIFRRSRVAVVVMIVFVILLQLYAWLIAHSIAGTLVTVIVVAFLLRGARRMFQDHAESQLDRAKQV